MSDFSIKVLIVDDEPLARRRIRSLLTNHENMEIVGECADGSEAVEAIENLSPDLMFLDVQMPEMDGLSVIKIRAGKPMPLIIFVTAYNNYGLDAFDSYAVDYLLKPFDAKRFEKALEKAAARLSANKNADSQAYLSELVNKIEQREKYCKHLAIRQNGRVFLVKTEEIEWIEAERNYVRLHVGQESYLRREAIGNIEEKFDSAQFRRIHRSIIVNINFIKELLLTSSSDYRIVLLSGKELTLSRNFQKNLPEFLG
ncbi:MAG TPA: LytTR family DNA-binding domain-containing protein [Pyrinomonadaceae bacterium]|jgi:two-component system LytT family response regulator